MTEIKTKILKTANVEWRKLNWLQDNLKELSKSDFEKLKTSLVKNGFIMPFHIWENGKRWILDGHHRQKAMQELEKEGYKIPAKLPANFIQCKDKKEAAKFVLIYSSIYAKATDEGLYKFINENELNFDDLKLEIDLPELNLDKFEQSYFTDPITEDEIPGLPKKAKTKTGDIYILGNHRLMCGDSTNSEDVSRLMNGKKADMMFTDPPYDFNFEKLPALLKNIDESCDKNIFIMAADSLLCEIIRLTNWKLRSLLFVELSFSLPVGQYFYRKHIPIGHFSKGKIDFINTKEGLSSVFLMKEYRGTLEDSKEMSHAKPVKLPNTYLRCFKCENVLDLFGGYGSTLIASEYAEKNCFMMEIEPKYCDLIIRRWENLTNKKAIRQ